MKSKSLHLKLMISYDEFENYKPTGEILVYFPDVICHSDEKTKPHTVTVIFNRRKNE